MSGGPSPYLEEAVGMRGNNRDISGLRIWIVERNVLSHGQMQDIFLFVGCGRRVFADMLAWNFMLDDAKRPGLQGRHGV